MNCLLEALWSFEQEPCTDDRATGDVQEAKKRRDTKAVAEERERVGEAEHESVSGGVLLRRNRELMAR